jgi:hypothetical protein
MIEMNTIIKEYERAKLLMDYEAVNAFWLVLLKSANQMPGSNEHERMLALVKKFPIDSANELLSCTAVDALINLSPPLEKILASSHERLYKKETQQAIEVIRSKRNTDPLAALISLGEILKRIRNKREHGFKTPDGPRDSEILSASRAILENMCAIALQDTDQKCKLS